MFKRKKKTGCETPEFRKPTAPPQYNPPPMPPVQPPKPPTSGSNAFKQNPKYVPSSVQPAKKSCTYKTPCGWCSKWDKECDLKPYKRGLRVEINPIDDAIGVTEKETLINKTCQSDADHEWECCGVSTAGTTYRCKKCYAHKNVPFTTKPLETYLTGTSVVEEIIDKVIKEN